MNEKISGFLKNKKFEILSFLLPVASWLIVFAFWGQYPFGDKTLLIWDADFQYVSFMAKWHDILHGRAGLFYSLSDSIGGNAFSIGAYYYIFSPLNLLVFFFKKESLYKCFCLIFFIKMGFMGSSFYHYLTLRNDGKNKPAGLPLTTAYTLSSYIVAYMFNSMWLDALILLPVVVAGVDRILLGKRADVVPEPYLVKFIALSFITNFYTAVIIAIFVSLYFVLAVLLEWSDTALKKCLSFVLSMAVGIGMACVVILPCLLAMMRGSRFSGEIDMMEVNEGVLTNFLWGSMPANQITMGIPLYYCGMLVFALDIFFFISKKIDLVKKLHYGLLLAVIMLSTRFRALDVVWGLGHETSGCPYRYSFLSVFIFCVIAADGIAVLFSEKSRMNLICCGIAAMIGLDLVTNALHFYDMSVEHYSKDAEEYVRNSRLLQSIHEAELSDEYRIEYGYYPNLLIHNIPFYMNTHGVSAYSSMEENKKVNVIEKLGYVGSYDGYNLEFNENNTLASRALLGIRYLVTSNERENAELLSESDVLRLYDDLTAFPMAFLAKGTLSEVRSADHRDYFSWMNRLYSEIIGKEIQVFEPLSVESAYLASGDIDGDPYSFTALSDGTQVIVNLSYKGDRVRTAYLRYGFEEGEAPRIDAYLNGEDADISGQENTVKIIGNVDKDSILILAITADEGQSFDMEKLGICAEDTDAVKEVCDYAGSQDREFRRIKDGRIEFKTTSAEDGLCVVSIPNDAGWKVYVDGKRADKPLDVAEGLMGIPLPKGEHVVKLKYHPPGLAAGVLLSLLSCGFYFLYRRRFVQFADAGNRADF